MIEVIKVVIIVVGILISYLFIGACLTVTVIRDKWYYYDFHTEKDKALKLMSLWLIIVLYKLILRPLMLELYEVAMIQFH